MQSITSILNDARIVEHTAADDNVRALAGLVQQLALRVQEAEALAATNELKLQSRTPLSTVTSSS